MIQRPTIGIITALPKEYVTMEVMLDKPRECYIAGRGAGRSYLLGNIKAAGEGAHEVVVALLTDMGNNSAATRSTLLLQHFPTVQLIFLSGIAGGVPFPEKPSDHVRLGDIVVSNRMGVIQYDYDKETFDDVTLRYPPRPPSPILLEAVQRMEVLSLKKKYPWYEKLQQGSGTLGIARPSQDTDILTSSLYPDTIVTHPIDTKRDPDIPRVFYGPIASANKLLKNPQKRDALRNKHGVKAIEMEGSGLADAAYNNQVGFLVVRGICDYCDKNKGDYWQEYAALAAAAYTTTIIEQLPTSDDTDKSDKSGTNHYNSILIRSDSSQSNQGDVLSTEDVNYLRTFASSFGRISLASMFASPIYGEVDLHNVYTTIGLNLDFGFQFQNGHIVDWWFQKQATTNHSGLDIIINNHKKNKMLADATIPIHLISPLIEYIEDKVFDYSNKYRTSQLPDGEYTWHNIDSEVIPSLFQYTVITGDPGSGKSTLLKHIALCNAGELLKDVGDKTFTNLSNLGFWPHKNLFPIYIDLRTLISRYLIDLDNEVTLDNFLDYIETYYLRSIRAMEYVHTINRYLLDGNVIILIDGLDEVPNANDPQRREQVKRLMWLIRTHYPKCRIVVTSRPYAYKGDWKLDGFVDVELAKIDENRLEVWIDRLFRSLSSVNNSNYTVYAFKEYLKNIPSEIRDNPLLLTLIAAIWTNNVSNHDTYGFLPTSTREIYNQCVVFLLNSWDKRVSDQHPSLLEQINISPSDLRRVLEFVAYKVHGSQSDSNNCVFESGLIMTSIRCLKIKDVNYDKLLGALSQKAGIIYEKSSEYYQFVHRTFQEYLTACFLTWKDNYPDITAIALKNNIDLWGSVLKMLSSEISINSYDTWKLIKCLVPFGQVNIPANPDDRTWYIIYLLCKTIQLTIQPDDELFSFYKPQIRYLLTELVGIGALSTEARSEMGRFLSGLGDLRLGVGIGPNELPEISWIRIPIGEGLKNKNLYGHDLQEYYISKYPVTNIQFQVFLLSEDGYKNDDWWSFLPNPNRTRNLPQWSFDNHPREKVSWFEAIAFCRWLSHRTGESIRLPLESEWEWAASGISAIDYPYGNEFDPDKGNTGETNIGMTSAVGLFPNGASPFGALDMSGNVWEWCMTSLPYDSHLRGDFVDYSLDFGRKVVKGGSRSSDRQDSKVSSRSNRYDNCRSNDLGFRLVKCKVLRIDDLLIECESRFKDVRTNHEYTHFVKDENCGWSHEDSSENIRSKVLVSTSTERITSQSISSKGDRIAFGTQSGNISIASLNILSPESINYIAAHTQRVRSVQFDDNALWLASCSDDGSLKLVSLSKGTVLIINAHDGVVYDLAFHPSGKYIATVGEDGKACLWDIEEAFSRMVGSYINSNDRIFPKSIINFSKGPIRSVAYNHDGSHLAFGFIDGSIAITNEDNVITSKIDGFEGYVCAMRYHKRLNLIVAGSEEGLIKIWDLDSGSFKCLPGHSDMVWSVDFDDFGNLVASSSKDQTVRLWDLSNQRSRVLKGHSDYVYCVRFHVSNNLLFSSGGDGTIREWDLSSLE